MCLDFKSNKIKTLEDVQEYLNNISFINNGGCGISAYSMFLWLKNNGLINSDFKFVLCYESYGEENYINNSNVLKDHSGNAIAPSHMVIYYNGEYLDSEGREDISKYKWVQHVTEEWFIVNCINNIQSWNHWFDRSVINNIEKTLDITLSNIEK